MAELLFPCGGDDSKKKHQNENQLSSFTEIACLILLIHGGLTRGILKEEDGFAWFCWTDDYIQV